MLRLLANEKVLLDAVVALRTAGHDVMWARDVCTGATDARVLTLAREEDRIVLTFDKDFGELVFRAGVQASPGVILIRMRASSPVVAAARTVAVVTSREDWRGHFSVADDHHLRMTPLPGKPPAC